MSAADESEKDGQGAREAAEGGQDATPAPADVAEDAPGADDVDATVAGRTATLGGPPTRTPPAPRCAPTASRPQ